MPSADNLCNRCYREISPDSGQLCGLHEAPNVMTDKKRQRDNIIKKLLVEQQRYTDKTLEEGLTRNTVLKMVYIFMRTTWKKVPVGFVSLSYVYNVNTDVQTDIMYVVCNCESFIQILKELIGYNIAKHCVFPKIK